MTDAAPDEKIYKADLLYAGKYGRSEAFIEGVCNEAVHDPFGVGHHRCGAKAKVTRTVEWHGKTHTLGYCGRHDPVVVEDRRAKRKAEEDARYKAQTEKWAEEKRLRELRAEAVNAIREIARGHNDARALAQEVLSKFGEEW